MILQKKQLLIGMFTFMILSWSGILNAQTVTMSFPGGIDNCAAPVPNAGNYSVSGTLNGKSIYVKGANSRIIWSGSQWECQYDDPAIFGVNWITAYVNINNTANPPADCWTSPSGCFLPAFSGAVSPAVSAVTITKSVNNKAVSGTATYIVTTTGTTSTLLASNFSVTTTGTITGASVGTVSNINATTWSVSVNTGTGDGTVTLNMINGTGTGTAFCSTFPVAGTSYTVNTTSAPVTLSAGDIGFVGYTGTGAPADSFSFVVTKNGGLPSGTQIYFTDNGYGPVDAALRPGEGLLLWTASSAVPQGTKVTISCAASPSASTGTASNILNTISFSTAGDQIIAFQGNLGSPTFISGIHMNANTGASPTNASSTLAGWDNLTTGTTPFTIGTSTSAIPPGLTNGTNAIMIATIAATNVEFDNAIHNCTGVTNAANQAALNAAINNISNWTYRDITGYPLPPSCTFSVVAGGPEMNIKGNGISIADADPTPTAADHTDFGSQSVCSGTIVRTFTIENTGTSALNLTGTPLITITGTHPGDFSITSLPTTPIGASGTTNFQVTFNPTTSGLRSAIIFISNNDSDENPYTFDIQGTGIDPEINIQGNSVSIADGDATPTSTDHTDFGSQSVCSGTIVRTFTIQNTGNSNLSVSAVNITGTNAGDFSVTSAPSSTVAAAGSTTFQVTFNPSASGTRSATITVSNNDCDEASYDFAIQGSGVDPEINIQGNSVSIADGDATPTSTDHTDFGSQSVCSGTIVRTFTIQNTGNSNLSVSSVNITGTNAADFSVTSAPSSTVAAAGSTTFQVTFNPSASGTRTATITVGNNDCDEASYDFAIQGTGIDPEINIQGNSVSIADGDATPTSTDHTDFGNQSVCSGTIVRTFTIQNTGNSNLSVSSVNITGTNAADFSVTSAPSSTVAAAGSTTFQVTFNPSAAGTRTATITVGNSDCDEAAYDFAIQGSGLDAEINLQGNSVSIADGDITPSVTDHTDFGNQSVCSGTIVRTFTIQNTGVSNLTISSVTINGPNASDFSITSSPSSTIAAAGSSNFQVTFNPSSFGSRVATIVIGNNDCDEAFYDFEIQGNGIDPEINIQGNSVSIADGDITPSLTDSTNFGATQVAITRSFTVENTGNSNLSISSVQLTGANAADFSISSAPSNIGASNNAKIYITYTPSGSNGARFATVTINNNDCNEGAYSFDISATSGICNTTSFNATICSNQVYNWNGVNRNTTGSYPDTFVNSFGCDSVVTLNLTVNPTKTSSFSQTICSNQSYTWNGIAQNTSGAYKDTFQTTLGCDSVVTLNLTVNPTKTSSFNQTICSNQSYTWNGIAQNTTGAYNDTFQTTLGCDSVVTLNLTVNPTKTSSFNQTICSNQTYL